MRIIDFHVHIKGGDLYRTETKAEEIIQIMDRAGIEKSVVFSICIDATEGNLLTYKEVKKFPERLIGFATGIPAFNKNVLSEIERSILEYGFRGIKIHRGIHTLDLYLIAPIIEKSISLDIPCLIDPVGDFEAIKNIVDNYPEAKLVIAHLGNGWGVVTEQFINLAREKPNVYLDTSYVRMTNYIGKAIKIAGSEKIIFGSDGPLIPPEPEIEKIRVFNLDVEQEENIFFRNAVKILKIME